MLEYMESLNIDPNYVSFQFNSWDNEYSLDYYVEENEELFNVRLRAWEAKVKIYDKWRRDHKEEIAKRKEEDNKQYKNKLWEKAKTLEKNRLKLEREQAKIEKKLDEMEG